MKKIKIPRDPFFPGWQEPRLNLRVAIAGNFYPCFDCHLNALDDAHGWGCWMVRDSVWVAAGLPNPCAETFAPDTGTYIHIRCLERRLGRKLTAADFIRPPARASEHEDDDPGSVIE
jgi:hypothetical protein